MAVSSITLGQLAFACYVFEAMAGYDQSYHEFRNEVGEELDLSDLASGKALLHWLNHWGCRHLATEFHDVAASRLRTWYEENQELLPTASSRLVSLPDTELDAVVELFDDLSSVIVAQRRHSNNAQDVTLAPTATAKTLFALRPHVFVPWDVAMRKAFGHDGSGRSYVAYLKEVRANLQSLERQCATISLTLDALPKRLGRERSTAAQLIDEYHYITVTRRVDPPACELLREWLAWR